MVLVSGGGCTGNIPITAARMLARPVPLAANLCRLTRSMQVKLSPQAEVVALAGEKDDAGCGSGGALTSSSAL